MVQLLRKAGERFKIDNEVASSCYQADLENYQHERRQFSFGDLTKTQRAIHTGPSKHRNAHMSMARGNTLLRGCTTAEDM